MSNRSDDFGSATAGLNGRTPSDTGSAWVSSSVIATLSGKAKSDYASYSADLAYLETSVTDGDAVATMSTPGNSCGPAMRISDTANGVIAYASASGITLYKLVGGSLSTIGTAYTGTISAGDIIKISVDGSNAWRVYQNATLRIGPVTDAFNSTATKAGVSFYSNNATARLDDFAFTEAASGGTTVTPGAASLAITTYAPTLTQTTNKSISPGATSLSVTTYAPTVTQSASGSITPGPASLTIATYAPTVTRTANVALSPGVKALTITTYAPTITQSSASVITPGPASLTITTYAPTVTRTTTEDTTPVVVQPAIWRLRSIDIDVVPQGRW